MTTRHPDHSDPIKSLARLEKAVAALDVSKTGSATISDLQKAIGAARAELRHGGGESVMKRAMAGDLQAQAILREAVINGAPSDLEQAQRAAEQIAKAKGRPAPLTSKGGLINSDTGSLGQHNVNPSRAIASGTNRFLGQLGAQAPSRTELPALPRNADAYTYPKPSEGNSPDLEAWWQRVHSEEIDPANNWEPIQQDARIRRTTTGPVMRDISDDMPVGSHESVGAGQLKAARTVEIMKIRRALAAEIARIRKQNYATPCRGGAG